MKRTKHTMNLINVNNVPVIYDERLIERECGKLTQTVLNDYYFEEYCNICITHSYLNNDIVCMAGGVPNPEDKPFIAEFIKAHKYTISY